MIGFDISAAHRHYFQRDVPFSRARRDLPMPPQSDAVPTKHVVQDHLWGGRGAHIDRVHQCRQLKIPRQERGMQDFCGYAWHLFTV